MTDNRTNEPTPEQVDAAAEGMWDRYGDRGMFQHAAEHMKNAFRKDARAALVAAQGAAPPLIWRLDLARHYWRSQGYDYDLHGLDGNNDYEMGLAVADAALAALAAAQGAAPQAGGGPALRACGHPNGHSFICACIIYPEKAVPVLPSSVAPQDNGKCGGCRDLGPHRNVPGCQYYEAPVLPSSTVDEDKLAEVIGSLDWGYMVDGPSVSEIARAVAEWLKGQGR